MASHGQRWARELPDEVLLVQTWLSVQAAVQWLDQPYPNLNALAELNHLTTEVKRRGIGTALLPAGRALRGVL